MEHIQALKKAGEKVALKKIAILVDELTKHPFTGTGKPEPLRHNLSGLWSRRINQKHRLIYRVEEDIVYIQSVKGHYS
ncbi:Txe/YoeB family addiction module toxin [Pedobacter sp. BS3]|uniref:Txe/YoeB family addiction module toxin n=1 Tax=Pedobacter sp. BS3 TaxID=2567937 RepID=UPI0011EF4EC1|nr:Txe/YoeB family addiction module toxin [Pedobacter sp. BS3]TZF82836.1 Txe/YoeB family addiction module toxin [Pedobacter sp. BS3]